MLLLMVLMVLLLMVLLATHGVYQVAQPLDAVARFHHSKRLSPQVVVAVLPSSGFLLQPLKELKDPPLLPTMMMMRRRRRRWRALMSWMAPRAPAHES